MDRTASLLTALLVIACGDSPREVPQVATPTAKEPTHLEKTIATQLSAKLGRTATVSCTANHCTADLGDAVLPISIASVPAASAQGSGDVEWSVDGLLVRAAPIEAYLTSALVELGAPQTVACGAAIRSVHAGARIECKLGGGGTAFAVIAADGTFSTEIELDPAAAKARTTEVTNLPSGGSGSATDDDD